MATSSVQLRVFDLFGGSVTLVPFQNFLAWVPLTGFRTVVEEISSSRNGFVYLRSSDSTPIAIGPGVDTRVVVSSPEGVRTELHGPSFNTSPAIRRACLAILELNDWGVRIHPSDVFLRNLTAHAYFTEWPVFAFPFPELALAESPVATNEFMTVDGPGTAVVDWVGIDGEILLRRHIEVGGSRHVAANGDLPLEFETDQGIVPVVPRLVAASGASLSIGDQTFEEFTARRCRELELEETVLRDARLPDAVRLLVRGSPMSRHA